MQINLTGHHVEVTPVLREYVTRKLDRITRHFDHVTSIHVVLTVEKQSRKKAEATLHVAGADMFADASHSDMYAAIDTLTDRLDGQVRKHKDKLSDHHRAEGGLKTQPLD